MRAALCLAAVLALQDAPPPIGLVEIYGLRHVAEAPVRQAVGLQAGDAFPESNKEIVARLERVPGVAEARLERRLLQRRPDGALRGNPRDRHDGH